MRKSFKGRERGDQEKVMEYVTESKGGGGLFGVAGDQKEVGGRVSGKHKRGVKIYKV